MIISIVNQKGGTGKTTTLMNLSAYLAHFGKKVLVIDLDPQANATSGFGLEKNKGIYEILSEKISLEEGIKKARENLWVIPSNENLAGVNVEIVNLPDKEFILKNLLEKLPNQYDFIFLDTPPSLGLLTINSLTTADNLIIPVQSEYYALEGLGQLLNTINLVQENLQPNLRILGAVITMYDERSRLSKEVWEELYKNFPYRIFRTIIPRNVRLAEAPSFGKTILEYAPNSKGARAYYRLAKEFLNILPQF